METLFIENKLKLIIGPILGMIIGFLIFHSPIKSTSLLIQFLGATTILINGYYIIKNMISGCYKNTVPLILHSVLGLFVLTNVLFTEKIFSILLATYTMLIGLIRFVNFLVMYGTSALRRMWEFANSMFEVGISLDLLLNISQKFTIPVRLFSVYLMVYSFSELLRVFFLDREEKGRKRHHTIPLPIILTAFIPYLTMKEVNPLLSSSEGNFSSRKTEDKPDIEVWVRTARRGFSAMGHVDISYKGKTYAYGAYDPNTSRLFGAVGDGVLFVVDTERYKESLMKEDERVVFAFGFKLTDQQKQAIDKKLDDIFSDTVPFELTLANQKTSHAWALSHQYGAKLYKFKASKFKTYFVMTTNCVLFADDILGETDIDFLDAGGMITPGSYLEYFRRRYEIPNSNVISVSVLGRQQNF